MCFFASPLFCFKAVAFWCLLPLKMGHTEHFELFEHLPIYKMAQKLK